VTASSSYGKHIRRGLLGRKLLRWRRQELHGNVVRPAGRQSAGCCWCHLCRLMLAAVCSSHGMGLSAEAPKGPSRAARIGWAAGACRGFRSFRCPGGCGGRRDRRSSASSMVWCRVCSPQTARPQLLHGAQVFLGHGARGGGTGWSSEFRSAAFHRSRQASLSSLRPRPTGSKHIRPPAIVSPAAVSSGCRSGSPTHDCI